MITSKIEPWVKIGAIVLLTIAALIYAGAQSKMARTDASFTVEGEATVSATPDLATFEFSVVTDGDDAAVVQEENNELANAAIAFVKEQGVAEKDIQTSYYDIYPTYNYNCGDNGCDNEIDGYTMTQTVEIKVRDTQMLGTLLSGVVDNGANSVNGPWFEFDDSSNLEQQAREEAYADARSKAEQIARAGGFKIGRITSVYEWTDNYTDSYRYAESSAYDLGGSITPAIETGEEDVTVNVSVTYEIK